MNRVIRSLRSITLAIVAACSVMVPVSAQAQAPSKNPVIIALPDQFPSSDGRALIVRYASAGKKDIIVLNRADATPDVLAAAIALLHHLRKSEERPLHDQVVTVSGVATRNRVPPATRVHLTKVLSEVRQQQSSRLGNLGSGQWIELPDARSNP